jgi:hypothetical protein
LIVAQRRTRAADAELETIGSWKSMARPSRSTLIEAVDPTFASATSRKN